MAKTMKKTTTKKTSAKKGVRKARRTYPKVRVNTGNKAYAVRTETFSLSVTAGQVTDFRDLNIAQYTTVCKEISQFYQKYRISSVQLKFKPNYDAYINNGNAGSAASVPYLYWMIDRQASIPSALNAAYFEELGVKATRIDDKTITRSYKPSVLQANVGVGIAPNPVMQVGGYRMAPWLPCNAQSSDATVNGFTPSDIEHHGCIFYISKTSSQDAQVYDVDVLVTVEFSKPLATIVASENALPYVKASNILAKGDLQMMGKLPDQIVI